MTMQRMFTIICDRCSDDSGPYGWWAARVREDAKAEGWERRDGQDVCPACVGGGFE